MLYFGPGPSIVMSFAVAVPRFWNILPASLRDMSIHSIRKLLKTHLAAQSVYLAANWPGVEPRIYDTLVRLRGTLPVSHGATKY